METGRKRNTHAAERERGHQVDSSPCQGIYPLPVTMILITVSDTGCVMVTVATLPPDLTLLNASSLLLKSFYLTLGHTHSCKNHTAFTKNMHMQGKMQKLADMQTAPR